MTTISAYEAKTHLSRLLERVFQGEEILITRRGRPVAVLSPPPTERDRVADLIKEMRSLRKGNVLGGDVSIRDMIEEGRR